MTNVDVRRNLLDSFKKSSERGIKAISRLCEECERECDLEPTNLTLCESCSSFFCSINCFSLHKRKYGISGEKMDPLEEEFGEDAYTTEESKTKNEKYEKIGRYSDQAFRFYFDTLKEYVLMFKNMPNKAVMREILSRGREMLFEEFKNNVLGKLANLDPLKEPVVTEVKILKCVLLHFFFGVWKNWKKIVKLGRDFELSDDEKVKLALESRRIGDELIALEKVNKIVKMKKKLEGKKGKKKKKKKKKRKKKKKGKSEKRISVKVEKGKEEETNGVTKVPKEQEPENVVTGHKDGTTDNATRENEVDEEEEEGEGEGETSGESSIENTNSTETSNSSSLSSFSALKKRVKPKIPSFVDACRICVF